MNSLSLSLKTSDSLFDRNFNLTLFKNDENLKKKIRTLRSVFRLAPSVFATTNLEEALTRKFKVKQFMIANQREEVEQPPPQSKKQHFSIQSMSNPCYNNLDLVGCINNFNTAYRSTNKLPPGAEAKNFIESTVRLSLVDTFNIIFDKKIESVIVTELEPINAIDIDNFGLKTYYRVKFLLQSNLIDLKRNVITKALETKCKRRSTDVNNEYYHMCSIDNQSILILNNLDLEEYDVCQRGVLQCPDYNYCYNAKIENPDFDFDKDVVAYECKCADGFESVYAPEPHFSHFLNHTCKDIDECASGDLNDCDENSTSCVNLIGSYKCECDKGYKRTNRTLCTELCSGSLCINGECKKLSDHEDYCQ